MSSIMNRMKLNYEEAYNYYLPYRLPIIIRLDGKSFHTFCKNLYRPFDFDLIYTLNYAARMLCSQLQTVQLAYLQSDEISLLLHPYKNLVSEPAYANKIQKLTSISSSIFTANFNYRWREVYEEPKLAYFDSRCFVLPESEVCNYFIARQQDWNRNSVQLLARSLYSQKELHKKNISQLHELCFAKGKNWNNLDTFLRRGRTIIKVNDEWVVDNEIPDFTKDRHYIEKYLVTEDVL